MKNTKQTFKILLLLFGFTQALHAQKNETEKFMRVYVGAELSPSVKPDILVRDSFAYAISTVTNRALKGYLGIAFGAEKEHIYWEIGAGYAGKIRSQAVDFSNLPGTGSNAIVHYQNYSAQIFGEFGFRFPPEVPTRWTPGIGFFGRLQGQWYDAESYTSVLPAATRTWAGGQLGFTPRLAFAANEKLELDLSLPFQLLQVKYDHSNLNRPDLTPSQNTNNILSFDIPLFLQIRVGAKFKLNQN